MTGIKLLKKTFNQDGVVIKVVVSFNGAEYELTPYEYMRLLSEGMEDVEN